MAPVSRLTHHLGVASRPRALRTSSLRMQEGEKEEELVQISRDELKELAEAAGITVKTTTEVTFATEITPPMWAPVQHFVELV